MKRSQTNQTEKAIIPEFLDEQMGIPVLLLQSAYEARSGDNTGVIIPDVASLEATIAIARVMDDYRIDGKELKFLRKAVGLKAIDLADFLSVTPETLSRWENDKEPVNANAERVIRMRVYNALRDKAPGVLRADQGAIVEMKFRSARPAAEALMMFRRMTAGNIWVYEGRAHTNLVQFPAKLSA